MGMLDFSAGWSRVVNLKIFGVYQTDAWLDLKVFLIAMREREKNPFPARKSNHGPRPITILTNSNNSVQLHKRSTSG
jgi:hypothetical protein